MNLILIEFDGTPENGMWADFELAGAKGAAFTLYPEQKHSASDYERAKRHLRYEHDVVYIRKGDYSENEERIYSTAKKDVKKFEKNHNVIL